MAVTWQFRDSVLVVTLVGKYAFEEPIHAVADDMSNARFRWGKSLLIDAQRSEAKPSSEDVRARAHWIASLVPDGISRRCAVVVSSQPNHYGLASAAGTHFDLQNVILEIFTDLEEAMFCLTSKAEQAGSGTVAAAYR